jgi:hypothetical protein
MKDVEDTTFEIHFDLEEQIDTDRDMFDYGRTLFA